MKMPLANKIQAIETALDSAVQKPDTRKVALALRLIRQVQRELFGRYYVREKSLRNWSGQYFKNGEHTDYYKRRKNWEKHQRDRELAKNQKLDQEIRN